MSNENINTAVDPVQELPVPDDSGEVYQLVYDYRVSQSIASLTGLHPLNVGLDPIMNLPDGIEILIWCMLTKMGPKWDIPHDQKQISREKVKAWMDTDIDWILSVAGPAVWKAYNFGSRSRRKVDAPPANGDGGQDPNEVKQKGATT